jgi:hypothetical protein
MAVHQIAEIAVKTFGKSAGLLPINRNSPDSVDFGASLAPLTGSGNGKSPTSRAEEIEADN